MAASQPTGCWVQEGVLSVVPMLFTYLGGAFWEKVIHMLLFYFAGTISGCHAVEA